MDYEEYIDLQTGKYGEVKKPEHYKIGQRKCIDFFFKREYDIPFNARILDVGCADGTGVKYLNELGYHFVNGVELNEKKIEVAQKEGLDVVYGDVHKLSELYAENSFDVIFSSHSFEHCFYPATALLGMKNVAKHDALFFFILPYPDIGVPEVHVASDTIGIRVDDEGETVINWFQGQDMVVTGVKFDIFREPEIWLVVEKDHA